MYYLSEPIIDNRFYDSLQPCKQDPNCSTNCGNNDWLLHSSMPLQQSIQRYAKLPISTNYEDKQPRLHIFSVDVAEGVTVTFDSYPKADGSRKSVYGRSKNEIVIYYNDGIGIELVMASGTVPEFYKYAIVPIHATDEQAYIDLTSNPKKIRHMILQTIHFKVQKIMEREGPSFFNDQILPPLYH